MKSNEVYLGHVLDEINFLLQQTQQLSFEQFVSDEVLRRADARSFEIIGEAVKNLSPEFKKKHKHIEWRRIVGFRDKLIHQYFGVNWNVLWNVIKEKLPPLKVQIEELLRTGNKS